MTTTIEVQRLTRAYRDVVAVDDVSIRVEENQILGLLGRNGAGKTTILRLLAGHEVPSSGDVRVFGADPFENERVLSQICFVREAQCYPDMRVHEVLRAAGLLQPRWDAAYAQSLAADFHLPPGRRVKKLSRGMRSALGIVIGLASRAPVTLFDEPYLGLDAPSRQLFYDRFLADYAEHPRTVIVSTHLIDEVANLLERIVVVDHGKVVIDGDAESLRGSASSIRGQADQVARFVAGRHVVHTQRLGSLASAAVLDPLDAADHRMAADLNLDVSGMSLQQMVVLLTAEGAEPDSSASPSRQLAGEGVTR